MKPSIPIIPPMQAGFLFSFIKISLPVVSNFWFFKIEKKDIDFDVSVEEFKDLENVA